MKPISLDAFDVFYFLIYTLLYLNFQRLGFLLLIIRKKSTLNVIKDFLTRCFAGIKGLTEYMNLPVFCTLFWIIHYEI